MKKIWVYIKKNDLQDKQNKRMINADANLKPIFVKDQISMFEMAGAPEQTCEIINSPN
ncbi:MAG: SWIB/MDM2 domain-containing protein [Puia sp.]